MIEVVLVKPIVVSNIEVALDVVANVVVDEIEEGFVVMVELLIVVLALVVGVVLVLVEVVDVATEIVLVFVDCVKLSGLVVDIDGVGELVDVIISGILPVLGMNCIGAGYDCNSGNSNY